MNLFNGKCRRFSSFQHQRCEALRRALINSYSKDDFSELGSAVTGSAATQIKLETEKPEPFVKTGPAGEASLSSFQYQGFEPLGRGVHNFSSEDDFSELGPPVAGIAATQLKLVTEKPEPSMKTDPVGKASASRRCLTDNFLGPHRTSHTSNAKFQTRHDVNWKNSLKVDSSSCSLSNENVHDGLDCCGVDSQLYKNSESSGRELQNHPLCAVKKATIRIQGIGKETTDPMIHSICKSVGALEGFARTDKDSVDALFRVTNGTDAQGLVQRLNNVVIDDCHWSAFQVPRDSVSASAEVGSKLALQINSSLAELKKQLDYKRIYFEDLQLLHMGIMHLEGLPTIRNPFDED